MSGNLAGSLRRSWSEWTGMRRTSHGLAYLGAVGRAPRGAENDVRGHDVPWSIARCDPGLHVNIPITPAPGVNGLAPRLSIAYGGGRERQRVDWDGPADILGYGWRGADLSAIHRCGKNTDNAAVLLGFADNLCLDGEPLVAVSGRSGRPAPSIPPPAKAPSRWWRRERARRSGSRRSYRISSLERRSVLVGLVEGHSPTSCAVRTWGPK